MRRFLIALILGLVTVIFAVVYLLSPRRDAEVALGLKWLPWSARNLIVNRDVWLSLIHISCTGAASYQADLRQEVPGTRRRSMNHGKEN